MTVSEFESWRGDSALLVVHCRMKDHSHPTETLYCEKDFFDPIRLRPARNSRRKPFAHALIGIAMVTGSSVAM